MKFIAKNLKKITGNKNDDGSWILHIEKITGEINFRPDRDGTGALERSTAYLISENENRRKIGLPELDPSRVSLWRNAMEIISLSKKEAFGLLSTKPGSVFSFRRKVDVWDLDEVYEIEVRDE